MVLKTLTQSLYYKNIPIKPGSVYWQIDNVISPWNGRIRMRYWTTTGLKAIMRCISISEKNALSVFHMGFISLLLGTGI